VKGAMLKRLMIFCLAWLLLSCSATSPSEKTKSTTPIPSINNLPTSTPISSSAPQVTEGSSQSSLNDAFSVVFSAPVIPSVVTNEEITMREQQIELAKDIEYWEQKRSQAGMGSAIDQDQAKYFRLTNEIQLLQAKQVLQQKQQIDNSKAK
jgi:hypothetical protein